MSRVPAAAGVALAGLLPLCAAALGLGEIQSRSYLNQPLLAEIPLISEVPGELAGLSVELAPAATFEQYGLQRPTALTDLDFLVTESAGAPVIRVTSSQPVTEPFVTLLIEVRWPQGRLLREFTVLLDPPAFTSGAVRQPVQAPATSVPPAPAPAATPPAPTPAPIRPEPATIAAPASEGTHVVVRNETLWGIAQRFRPDSSVNINQVMLAIYRANPDAFAGNINRLKAGAVLQIPESGAIGQIARNDAAAEVRRQVAEWRAGTAARNQAEPVRLELVPPEDAALPPAAASSADGSTGQLRAQLDESRRLLAVKDAELKLLRDRLAEFERQQAATAVTGTAPAAKVAPAPETAAARPKPEAAPVKPKAKPSRPPAAKAPAPADREQRGLVGTLIGLLKSAWLWLLAAVVLVAGLLVMRRGASSPDKSTWRSPQLEPVGTESTGAGLAGRGDGAMIVEESAASSPVGVSPDRRAPLPPEVELPLERTLSSDGTANLDHSDPLAEADFHMAYGLYDQAADLLMAAVRRDPARRDLQMKLLDVFFVWENREGFLQQAQALHSRIANDFDPDWKRVVIMGKQLCPDEPMFAGDAAPAAEDMDLALSEDSIFSRDAGLDLDLAVDAIGAGRASGPAATQEVLTLESRAVAGGGATTMETPTLESSMLMRTMESPTIEAPAAGRTMETPTLEVASPSGFATERLPGGSTGVGDLGTGIDPADLGLDLSGLDEAARDIGTGRHDALPETGLDLDFSDAGLGEADAASGSEIQGSPTLREITSAMSKGGAAVARPDDTAEQQGLSDSMIAPLGTTRDDLMSLDIDLSLGEAEAGQRPDLTATGLKAISGRRPEDPTMTEVGTKLDLARAYVDMGDPDGARSILNEVVEEGDEAQRQEAREMLDLLGK